MQITESYYQWLCSDSEVVEDRALMKHQWMGEELRPQRRFSSDVWEQEYLGWTYDQNGHSDEDIVQYQWRKETM